MSSKSLYALCFLALLAFAHASNFKRLHFNQGKTNLRNLDASDSPMPSVPFFPFHDYSHNFAVAVNLGEDYLKRAGMNVYAETDMLLLLYTNVTGFCSEHSQFVQYKCENNSCNADTSVNETMISPYITIKQGDPVAHKVTIGRDDSVWQLEANAILFNHTLEDIQNVVLDGGNRSYIQGNDTFGFIGLGVGGDAHRNFKSGPPLFSIQVNAAGKGQLIFGKDDKLYDYTLTPASLPADTNWTLLPSSINFGPVKTLYKSKILFDLQSPGVGIDSSFFDSMLDQLKEKYQFTNDTSYGNDDFHYVFKGELSQLPFLNITLDTDTEEVVSIPPSGYTRRVANNTYVILLYRVEPVVDEFGASNAFTMLGWPVLSQFYTIFEFTRGAPIITMYPTYASQGKGNTDPVTPVDPVDPVDPEPRPDPRPDPKPEPKPDDTKKPDTETPVPSASNPWIIRGAAILIVVVIILVAVKASQKKAGNKLEEDLNVGLTGSAVL